MNINELTLEEAKQIITNLSSTKSHPFEIGKNYFIRTVTMSHVGKLEAVYEDILVFSNTSWIADSGRFSDAMKQGLESLPSSEIEPFVNNVFIGRGALIDMTEYNFALPTKQK